MKDFESNQCWVHLHFTFMHLGRCFNPKWLTVHSGYTIFVSMCVPWELNPQPFVLLTQCSTTEPQEHTCLNMFEND